MRVTYLLLQVTLLCGLYEIGEWAMRSVGIPIPGNVAGMGFLLLLLVGGWLPVRWVEAAADLLLRRLSLLFLPLLMGLGDLWPLIAPYLGRLLAVVVVSTAVVMVGSAGVTVLMGRRMRHAGT